MEPTDFCVSSITFNATSGSLLHLEIRVKKLKKVQNCEVFHLPENLQSCIKLETREGKADIVRLSFGVEEEFLEELISDPSSFMELIQQYCVAPLRRIYAEVYRIKRK